MVPSAFIPGTHGEPVGRREVGQSRGTGATSGDEAHKLLDEAVNVLTEMRRDSPAGRRQPVAATACPNCRLTRLTAHVTRRATRHLSRGIRHAIFLTRSDRTRLLSLTGHPNCRAIGGLAAKAKLLTGIEEQAAKGIICRFASLRGDGRPLGVMSIRGWPCSPRDKWWTGEGVGQRASHDTDGGDLPLFRMFAEGLGDQISRIWRPATDGGMQARHPAICSPYR